MAITGCTGSGKTDVLQEISERRRTLDLEALASHRGSAFGSRLEPQPAPATFENRLALALWRAAERKLTGPIVLEDESRRIGRLEVPAALFEKLSEAPLYVIERPFEERARYLIAYYLADYRFGEDPDAFARLRAELRRALLSIERRLGGAETRALVTMADEASDAHERAAASVRDPVGAYQAWAERLLRVYYDPLYAKHLVASSARVAIRGSPHEIADALLRL